MDSLLSPFRTAPSIDPLSLPNTRRKPDSTNFSLIVLSSLVIAPAAFSSHTLDIRLRVFGALTLIYTVVALIDTKIHTSGSAGAEDTTLNGNAKTLPTPASAPVPVDPTPGEVTTVSHFFRRPPNISKDNLLLTSQDSDTLAPAPADVPITTETEGNTVKPYDVDGSGSAVPVPVVREEKKDDGEVAKVGEDAAGVEKEEDAASDEDGSKKEIPNDWEKVENEGEEKNTQESVS